MGANHATVNESLKAIRGSRF